MGSPNANDWYMLRRPYNRPLNTIEKNVIKIRALEHYLYLHEIEAFRGLISSIIDSNMKAEQNSDMNISSPASKFDKKLRCFVKWNVISQEEYVEIVSLINYRNDIAHQGRLVITDSLGRRHDHGAIERIRHFRHIMLDRMWQQNRRREHFYIFVITADYHFREVVKAIEEEIRRLKARTDKLLKKRQVNQHM
jgi:hypothetical protein